MSLMRSFTTRRTKPEELAQVHHLGRAASQRAGKPVYRSQISSPVALISTTNVLSYEAPNIAGTRPIGHRDTTASSSASSHSGEDSDASTLSIDTNTDASSVEQHSPITPEPNHLSCYFKSSADSSARTSLDAPAIPQRVPSHSKKAHERLHRKRSVQRIMSPPASIVRRRSTEMFKVDDNPFGGELAQLEEVAEEFSHAVRDAEANADAVYMESHGLAYFGPSDYLSEIHSLIHEIFLVEETCWI